MGTFVTRYRVEDEVGRIMTVHGEFLYEDDGWLAEFRDEEEALEAADILVGSLAGLTVERYQRWSERPDFVFPETSTDERAAA